MAELGLPWQEWAKRNSVWDYFTQKIIDGIDDDRTRNIKVKKFPDATRSLSPFAVADQKIIYMPIWVESCFEPHEFEWIVFHEVGHIIYNHKYENPLVEDCCADEYAVRLQCRIKFGVCYLRKITREDLPRTQYIEKTIKAGNGEIQLRINRLKGLGLPW